MRLPLERDLDNLGQKQENSELAKGDAAFLHFDDPFLVADESTASGTSGSAVTSSSGSKVAGIAPLPSRNNGISTEQLAPPANNTAPLDTADGERLKPIQLMPPPIRLPIDKAGFINGVGKLELLRIEDEKQQQQSSEDGLVMMTIQPDEKGRFGFNVKGGADQKMPIIVSRVGVNTPADRYILEKFFTLG